MFTLYIIYATTTGIISSVIALSTKDMPESTAADKASNAALHLLLGQFTLLFTLYIHTTNQHQSNTHINDY